MNKLEKFVEKIDNNVSVLIESQSMNKKHVDNTTTTPSSNTRSKVISKKSKTSTQVIAQNAPTANNPCQKEFVATAETSLNKTFREALAGGSD